MPDYTFYLLKDADAVSAFEIAHFDDADPALDHGRKLLKERPRYNFVEIAQGDQSIGKFSREAL